MDIETLVVGELQENCYVCTIGNNTFIVDPGDEVEKIIDACKKKNVKEILVRVFYKRNIMCLVHVITVVFADIDKVHHSVRNTFALYWFVHYSFIFSQK